MGNMEIMPGKRAAQVPLKRLVMQKMQAMAEHDCIMVLTGGEGFPKPTVWPPKQEQYCGILRTENVC